MSVWLFLFILLIAEVAVEITWMEWGAGKGLQGKKQPLLTVKENFPNTAKSE